MKKMSLVQQEMRGTMNDYIEPILEKIAPMLKDIDKMQRVLDSVLDKPLDENDPRRCCGDFLCEIQSFLTDEISIGLRKCRKYSVARACAHSKYPYKYDVETDGDENEVARRAYLFGYLEANTEE